MYIYNQKEYLPVLLFIGDVNTAGSTNSTVIMRYRVSSHMVCISSIYLQNTKENISK